MYNLIEDYLDRLCLPLIRRLPYHERQRIRQELRDHLLEHVSELKAQGVSDDEAVSLALKQFGSPEWVGTLMLEKRTPLPRLNWWRAIVLIVLVALTSLFVVSLSPLQPHMERRQQQIVDVMLWTAGPVLLENLPEVRNTLFNLQYVSGLPLPPVPLASIEPAPPLGEIDQLVRTNYQQWLEQFRTKSTSRPESIVELYPSMRLPGSTTAPSSTSFRPALPISVCDGYFGCWEPLPATPSLVSTALTLTLFALAAMMGVLMRRLRWVVATGVAAWLLSLVWCGGIALQETGKHPVRSLYEIHLQQIVDRLEQDADRLSTLTRPAVTARVHPILSAQDLKIRDESERPQRIRQLAQLFRYYQREYVNAWQRWNEAGLLMQTWWVFRHRVLVSWWSVPAALIALLTGGWLGIWAGIWSWRWRSYLIHRYA
ncbi:MAG: hypothetical protein KatS3mg023_0123 [Armatimonadota bacterium]|nr:MAG: hypothetical protein KatS3mg023_0123 [Armatimonadota bacterium]